MNYPETARQRWPHATIHGDGRYAVVRKTEADVHLFDSWQRACSVKLGWDDAKIEDLEPRYVPNIPDNWEDREWMCKQQR